VERDPQHLVRGTSEYRRGQRFQRLAHEADVLIALAGHAPGTIYCGLLWYARNGPHRRWKDEYAACAFKEIFGIWPRPEDKGAPERPPIELEEWIIARQKRRRQSPGKAIQKARETAA
jgi:hypothetical protein